MAAPRARFVLIGTLACACGGTPSSEQASNCATPCAADCQPPLPAACPDLAPVPVLRFQLEPPGEAVDYAYTVHLPPATPPAPGAEVFLSAKGSEDPEGGKVRTFWSVQDPSDQYLTIEPEPTAEEASFIAARTGTYRITLQVTELTGRRQTSEARLELSVTPQPCSPDGASPPCANELPVAGGTFLMGSPDADGFASEHPRHEAAVSSFLLDQYEVTVGRFRRYAASYDPARLSEGAGADLALPNSGWSSTWLSHMPESAQELSFALAECGGTWTEDVGANEARPISCVTWFEAMAFCAAEGKRLPTEAEWEYAASGGDEQRRYPWGDEAPSIERAVFGCLFDGNLSCTDADLPVAGSLAKGAGRFHHLDLAGSVWEWTQDVYAPYTDATCDGCAVLRTDESPRVFRGGDFKFEDRTSLRASTRYAFLPAFPDPTRGFRCARSLPAAP